MVVFYQRIVKDISSDFIERFFVADDVFIEVGLPKFAIKSCFPYSSC